MLTIMNEMSMASIVATAGQNDFIAVLWIRCLSVQALYLRETVFIVQGVVLVWRFVALYWQRSDLDVGMLVT